MTGSGDETDEDETPRVAPLSRYGEFASLLLPIPIWSCRFRSYLSLKTQRVPRVST